MNIVEHVKFAVAGAQLKYMANLRTNANNGRFKVGETYVFEREGDMIARAAIIATLQFARDNASAEMIESGVRMDLTDGNAGEDAETRVSDVFRSMVDALLQEIGGGE